VQVLRLEMEQMVTEKRIMKTDMKYTNDVIDTLLKRLSDLRHALEHPDKKTIKVKTTDIIFLFPLISQAMARIISSVINL